jgi:hypothetical protein
VSLSPNRRRLGEGDTLTPPLVAIGDDPPRRRYPADCAPASSPAPPRTGTTVWKMQAVSRHKTLDVLSGYVRDADAFKNHAGEGFL